MRSYYLAIQMWRSNEDHRASPLITDTEELRQVIEWHRIGAGSCKPCRIAVLLIAIAEKAVHTAAYSSAAKFVEDALLLLKRMDPDHWITAQTLSFELSLMLATRCAAISSLCRTS